MVIARRWASAYGPHYYLEGERCVCSWEMHGPLGGG